MRSIRRRSVRRKRQYRFEVLEPRLNMAVPAYSSLPGASHTIYLDFDGHVTTGTNWNSSYGVTTINSPAYSTDADTANFSTGELQIIERTFKRVAEDFAPFQVNVTTVEPALDDLRNAGGADTKWGVRVVVTRDVAFNCGCGGIAYINSFTWNSDTPVYVFNTSEIGVAEAASHEVGHSLGLSHDGTSTAAYYQGHGLGTDTAYWSTIMGVGYYVDVSQWDRGEYFGSNNASTSANYGRGPDDLAIITGFNGFGYKADDHANATATASALNVNGSLLSGAGVITTRTDSDYFQFSTAAGSVTLNVNPADIGGNLDIEATLYDSSGAVVATSNPLLSLAANITANVPAGQYFLKIDGVGAGNPTVSPPTGYTDYASIGQYSISGSIVPIAGGDALAISTTDTSKPEGNAGSTTYIYTVTRSGDTSGTTTVNYSVTGTGASPASASDFVGGLLPGGSLTFAPNEISQTIAIDVQGDTTVESTESFAVTLSGPSATTVLTTASVTSTIANDDVAPAPPTLRISATSASKAEGTGGGSTPFVFTITRSGDTSGTSSVRYSVAGGANPSASNNDLTNGFVRNVTVNFAAGVASVDVTVLVRQDSRRESNENFVVSLSGATGATIATASATGVILNDDGTAAGQAEDSEAEDLIAVADPLWSFMPADMLTPEQLAVPIVTWINGQPFIGDLAHDHDHELDHHDLEHDHFIDHDHEFEGLDSAEWDWLHDSALELMASDSSLSDQVESTAALAPVIGTGPGTQGSFLSGSRWRGTSRTATEVQSQAPLQSNQLASNLLERSSWNLTSRVYKAKSVVARSTTQVDAVLGDWQAGEAESMTEVEEV